MGKKILLGILILAILIFTDILPITIGLVIAIGPTIAIIFAVYIAIKALMDHNAELKRHDRRDDRRD